MCHVESVIKFSYCGLLPPTYERLNRALNRFHQIIVQIKIDIIYCYVVREVENTIVTNNNDSDNNISEIL